MNLCSSNCHNFKKAEENGRCSLLSVCDEDCVYVWKDMYDHQNNYKELEEEIEELQETEAELTNKIQEYEEKIQADEDKYNGLSSSYKKVISDLTDYLPKEAIKELVHQQSLGNIGEWFDVISAQIDTKSFEETAKKISVSDDEQIVLFK